MTGLPIPPKIIQFDDSSPFLSAFATSYATSSTASSEVSTDPTSMLPSEGKVETIHEQVECNEEGGAEEEADVENVTATLSDATATTSETSYSSNTEAEDEAPSTMENEEAQASAQLTEDAAAEDSSPAEETTLTSAASESGSTTQTHVDEEPSTTEDTTPPSTEEQEEEEETAPSVGYSSYYIGDTSISDSLKHIANAFDEKCREVEILRKMKDKYTKQAEEEKQALQSSVDSLRSELAALKDEMNQKDQLLAMSDKISTSLFGVLMTAKSTLDQADALAPALRTFSQSYAPSVASTDEDEDEQDDTPATTDNEDDTITQEKAAVVA